jgi:hypothetical protein
MQLKGIDLKPIEEAIISNKSNEFFINHNYEIIIPESGKSLLHPNYYDITTLKKLFDKLYEEKNQFFPCDVEVESHILTQRLNALRAFLRKLGEDSKPVNRIISNIRSIDGTVKIESLTFRIFDDFRNPIFSKALMHPEVRKILVGFCQQWELGKQELLYIIENLSN